MGLKTVANAKGSVTKGTTTPTERLPVSQPLYVTPEEVTALIQMTQDNMEEVPTTMLGTYSDRPFVTEDWAVTAVQAMRGR
jgi:hypothetical protein